MEEQKVKSINMNNLDARGRVFKETLASERRKWEFRYENQDKRIKELEATIKRQKTKIRELKAERADET